MILPKRVTNTILIAAVGLVGMLFLFVTELKAQVASESTESVKTHTAKNSVPSRDQPKSIGKGTTDKTSKNPSVVNPRLVDNSGYRLHDKSAEASEGKSTLSFNIFLFVLDRFKEDQEAIGEKGD